MSPEKKGGKQNARISESVKSVRNPPRVPAVQRDAQKINVTVALSMEVAVAQFGRLIKVDLRRLSAAVYQAISVSGTCRQFDDCFAFALDAAECFHFAEV